MNRIKITKIVKESNKIICDFETEGEVSKAFSCNKFFVSYDSVIDIPNNIAVIPFICNILPIIWIYDVNIEIEELDKDFHESISKMKQSYQRMYPKCYFKGNINVKKIIKNKYNSLDKQMCLFSGGVDAFSTLITQIDKKPILTFIHGSDITLDNETSFKKVEKQIEYTAELFDLNKTFIKSNFREFLNYEELNKKVYKNARDYYWHGFQHGIGLISLVAGYAYTNKISTVYIASSYTLDVINLISCASHPDIDNNLKIGSCNVFHDGVEKNRLMKIENICNYLRKRDISIFLRVCWQSDTGVNCCKCEKCYRTIMCLLAVGEKPEKYGLNYNPKMANDIKKTIMDKTDIYPIFWQVIQDKFIANGLFVKYPELMWFQNLNLNKVNYRPTKIKNKFIKKLKKIIKKSLRLKL